MDRLINEFGLVTEREAWSPLMISRFTLLQCCSPWFLFRLNYAVFASKIVELPLWFLPTWLLRYTTLYTRATLLNPMLLCTQGSVDGAIMALKKGYAFNLGGGYHHASRSKSHGFCVFPDITLAIKHVRKYFGIQKSMVIDLDAHQGDGHERDFKDDPDTYIVDFFNADIFPGDMDARKSIKSEFHLRRSTTDKQYTEAVSRMIEVAIMDFEPEFILYNAGTDIASGDPLGALNVVIL